MRTKWNAGFATALLLFAAAPAARAHNGDDGGDDGDDDAPPSVPAALDVPAGQSLAFDAIGRGVQIYVCTAGATTFSWAFRAPEATLFHDEDNDGDGKVIGIHYAGPTWQDDHGLVVGAVAARVPSPDPGAIPWLRLSAVSHEGHGRFAHVTSIQRLDTVGGIAPASGCDASQVGAVARVPYSARYYFYQSSED